MNSMSVLVLVEFYEVLKEAEKLGIVTEVQKEALEAKKKQETLSMQHRNALRALRIIKSSYAEDMERLAKDMIRRKIVAKLLAEVDKPKGMICYQCKNNIMIEGTASFRKNKEDFELILEHLPGRVCVDCDWSIFESEVVKQIELIGEKINTVIKQLNNITQESLDSNKCPMCMGNYLVENHQGEIYRYQQGLFHLILKKILLRGFCTQCGYELIGDKTNTIVDKLIIELTLLAFELIKK